MYYYYYYTPACSARGCLAFRHSLRLGTVHVVRCCLNQGSNLRYDKVMLYYPVKGHLPWNMQSMYVTCKNSVKHAFSDISYLIQLHWLLQLAASQSRWRCEHARFCVEVFYAPYINFHSFIHSSALLLAFPLPLCYNCVIIYWYFFREPIQEYSKQNPWLFIVGMWVQHWFEDGLLRYICHFWPDPNA